MKEVSVLIYVIWAPDTYASEGGGTTAKKEKTSFGAERIWSIGIVWTGE